MNNNRWYFSKGLKPHGPVSYEEMRLMIYRGDVGPNDLISAVENGEWKAACEWKVFEEQLFPATQNYKDANPNSHEKIWVMLVPRGEDGVFVQEGPYDTSEIRRQLDEFDTLSNLFIWKPGLSGWCRVEDRPEFIVR